MPSKSDLRRSKINYVDLAFPWYGLHDEEPFSRQPPGTTSDARNVRCFEPGTDKKRGGSRPGLSKYFQGTVNGNFSIQDINHITTTFGTAPVDDSGSLIRPFIYGLPVGGGNSDGFGIARGDTGVSVTTVTNGQTLDGYAFEC